MSAEYAAGIGRPPFLADGRLITRRAMRQGELDYPIGEEMPRLDLTPRQVAVLWEQGWIDTLPLDAPPAKAKAKGDGGKAC